MQTKLTSLKSIGSFIDKSEALLLRDGFSKKYPSEIASINVSKKIIEKILSIHTDICGIKFLYGLERMADPTSKFIMLVPCTFSSDNSKPVVKLSENGFFTSSGHQIELISAWESLSNYVSYMMTISPELGFEDISRYCYFGKNSIESLLSIENVQFIKYIFGYDDFSNVKTKTEKYRIVLEPISDFVKHDIYMDHGSLVPPDPSKPSTCFIKTTIIECNSDSSVEEINIFRNYRDQLLSNRNYSNSVVEMYYQTTDALVDKINNSKDKKGIYNKVYQSMISTSEELVDQTEDRIKETVSDRLTKLINQYLLN